MFFHDATRKTRTTCKILTFFEELRTIQATLFPTMLSIELVYG